MHQTPIKRRGRPSSGAALSGAERQRRYMARLAVLFAESVNPASLSECLAELHYWSWLYDIRWRMGQTEHPGEFQGDEDERISARRYFVESLLTVLAPLDRCEAIRIADGLKGVVDDAGRQVEILHHLLRTAP